MAAIAVTCLSSPVPAQWPQGGDPLGTAAQRARTIRAEWSEFAAAAGGSQWHVVWSDAAGTPRAIYGPGARLQWRAVGSREDAERLAADWLDRHRELLGRGASEFRLDLYGKVHRTHVLVYQQEFRGLEVVDGRADVRLNDNGVVALFGSECFDVPPDLRMDPTIDEAEATRAALTAQGEFRNKPQSSRRRTERALQLRAELQHQLHGGPAGAPRTELVVWASRERANCTPKLAWKVELPDLRRPGTAYVDALTGQHIEFREYHAHWHRRSHSSPASTTRNTPATDVEMAGSEGMRMPVSGTVMAWVADGFGPSGALVNRPIGGVRVQVQGGGSSFTDEAGAFSIPHTGTAPIPVTVDFGSGEFFGSVTTSQGTPMSTTVTLTPGSPGAVQIYAPNAGEFEIAQSTAALLVDQVARYMREPHILGSQSATLASINALTVAVNDTQQACNAFFQPGQIVFAASGQGCPNFAFGTVVEHEWGHALDNAFGGIGGSDLGEGFADVVTNYFTGQPIIGENFSGPGQHVRDATNTAQYPNGQAHDGGLPWMGGCWKLRQRLIGSMGATAGRMHAETIVLGSLVANAQTIPDAVREVFVLDDNDGNLNNGTPNCRVLFDSFTGDHSIPSPVRSCSANPGLVQAFGSGCPGTGLLPSTCESQNVSAVGSGLVLNAPPGFRLAYAVVASQTQRIDGVELYTRSASGGGTLSIHRSNGADPAATPVATVQLTVGTSPGWYGAQLSTPLSLTAGERIYLVHDAATFDVALVNSGSTSASPTRMDPGFGFWAPLAPGIPDSAAWRLTCVGGGQQGAVPELRTSDVPEIGRSMTLQVAMASPNTVVELIFGQSDQTWGGRPLPYDLASLGAPGCSLHVSFDSSIMIPVDPSGAASWTVQVPNAPALVGFVLFTQGAVLDPGANAFGVAMTGALRHQVGTR